MTTKSLVRVLLGGIAAATISLGAVPAADAASSANTSGPVVVGGQNPFSGTTESVCASAPSGYASCLARVIDRSSEQSHLPYFTRPGKSSNGGVSQNVTVSGLSPTNIDAVYGFSGAPTSGAGKTIALVDAYDDPTAANDLTAFSTQWGLPACLTSTGCFTKVNETGGTSLPAANASWALEISLDIEWAHAIAPAAKILLVEANSNSMSDLMTADQYAGSHANYVSNSWGGSESSGEIADDAYLTGGASFFAATGDTASAVDYPATSPNVTAVGGTSLSFNSNGTLASESAWSDGGGGCSKYESAPAAQLAFAQYAQTGCGTKRAVPDVSLDANPNSGVAVYDSTPYDGGSGWWTVGGTSVATPIWAAESAASGISPSPQLLYSTSTVPFRDITSGSNGHSALVGYDLATGRGSWAIGSPAAASGLTGTASSGAVALTWSADAGATSYDIYRGTSATSLSTTRVGTSTTTSFNDTTVTNGKTYYYEVEGVNSTGVGTPSNEISASPVAPPPPPPVAPAAPTGLKAAASSASVALSWSSVTGATGYDILRGVNGATETAYVSVTGTSYADSSVTPGDTYYYEVEAFNTAGPGPADGPVSATVPSRVTASISKSCRGATCTFTSTSTDQGGTITAYSWTTTGAIGTGPTFQHTVATAGNYVVDLTATDDHGSKGSASVSVSCTTPRVVGSNKPSSGPLTCS